MNETIIKRLGTLLSVKSLVTLALTAVFAGPARTTRRISSGCSRKGSPYSPALRRQFSIRLQPSFPSMAARIF